MKKSKHARRQSTTMAVKAAHLAPPHKSSRARRIRYAVYAIAILAAVGVRFYLTGPNVPLPSLEGMDPLLAEEIENARASIWEAPRQPKPWGQMGMLLAAHSFTAEAVQCFDKAEKLDPASWQWPYLRAIAQEQTDPAAARDALREAAIVAGEDEPLPRLLLVERLLEAGELDEAEQHLEIALRYWPDHPRAALDRARLLLVRDDAEGALEALNKAAKDRHTRRTAHQLLAQLHLRLGDQQSADEALAAVKQLPRDESWRDRWRDELESFHMSKGAFIARINELGRRGDYDKLKRTLAASIERYPDLAHLIAGRQRLAGGDMAGAERALREAVRLDPRSVDALLSLGEALERQRKDAEAEDVLRRAVIVEPSNGETHLRLGRCLLNQKVFAAALTPLRSAVQFMPTSAEAHSALADAMAAAGNAKEADEHRRLADRLSTAAPPGS